MIGKYNTQLTASFPNGMYLVYTTLRKFPIVKSHKIQGNAIKTENFLEAITS